MVGSGFTLTNVSGQNASVIWDGTQHVVTWTDTRSGNSDVYYTRVLPDGTVLDPGAPGRQRQP